MTILINLSVAGINTGPFNLYSDADGYVTAFALNVTRQQLLDGYPAVVPNGTLNIKLQSLSDICPNDTILSVSTTSTISTTTTLNCSFVVNAQEVIPTTTTTTTIGPIEQFIYFNSFIVGDEGDFSIFLGNSNTPGAIYYEGRVPQTGQNAFLNIGVLQTTGTFTLNVYRDEGDLFFTTTGSGSQSRQMYQIFNDTSTPPDETYVGNYTFAVLTKQAFEVQLQGYSDPEAFTATSPYYPALS